MNVIEPRTAELATDVRVAVGRLGRRLRKEKAQHDMSDTMFAVLAYLFREGPKTLGELADYEQVKPPSMTRTVNCLVDDGLAERMPDARDGRVTRIRPTTAGSDLVLKVRESRNAWLVQQLADLTADERATLADAAAILRRLTD
ncbi:MarR family transcriptional regulator [Microbacteriaceae bacterium VKM Ac-2855]|nr:MarR family transcriptional regulator [Microbacteriaceae bacterium VKM Ac-2855]